MTKSPLGRRTVFGGGAALMLALALPATGMGAPAPAASVQVGDFNRTPEISFNTFLPNNVRVTQGSTVKFTVLGFHTVTFPKKGATLPAFIIPTPTLTTATNDPGGAPYWWGGVVPVLSLNPAAAAPSGGTAVTGAKTVSSGLLPDKKPFFTVSFPKKGTFSVRCLIHPNMKGSVTVVAKSGTSTPAATAKKLAAAQKKADRAAVDAAIKKAKANTTIVSISPGNKRAQAFAFYPAKKTVAVGSQLTFKMSAGEEVHTVSFGPAAFLGAVSKATFGGSGLTVGAEGTYPTDAPVGGVPAVPAVTPTSHGNGFVSSGVLRDPGTPYPQPTSFTVSFPTAGTYSYICLIHPEMHGTITVQ